MQMLFYHNYILPSSVLFFQALLHISEYTVYCCFGVSLAAGILYIILKIFQLYINSTSGWKKVPAFSADKGWNNISICEKKAGI